MTVTFATGTDARLFWNACALAESFAAREPVRLLHPTSQGGAHHLTMTMALRVGERSAELPFKTFRRRDLRDAHAAALEAFVARHAAALAAHGLLGAA
jgi:hypothetical protein